MSDAAPQELSPIKRALLEIRDLRAQIEALEQARSEPVAVVGVGLRFPNGVHDLHALWEMLRQGVDAITEIPPERWNLEQYYDEDPAAPGKMTTRFGSFVEAVDQFDAAFFGISPREAVSMDPQQRLLLETTWEALENAGIAPDSLAHTATGVFIGISNSDYFRMVVSDAARIDTYASTGGSFSVASGRIAYLLGLHGPAISVDTACSSSLVAVHLACQSLREKECQMALVGGVNLTLTPEANINFSKATGMMAPDGRCKTFDDRADGYVRGEGCAVLVLKPLSNAQADGDPILAVIRGSAINQDGRSSGLTAPNGPAQEAVIRAALRSAGVEARQVGYVEAHGTGTSLGDPIEVQALGAVYGAGRDRQAPLYLGSIKTNIGHLEAAAGLAGLLKAALVLQHGQIPPHLHFETPSTHIAWEDYPLAVAAQGLPWPDGAERFAAVSSFGFSGTNAHIILEAAPAAQPAQPASREEERVRLLPLSAKSPAALEALAERYLQYLEAAPLDTAGFSRLADTLGRGRAHYPYRLAVRAAGVDALRDGLQNFQRGQIDSGWWSASTPAAEPPAVAFLFTGHGSHSVNMGRALYETEPVFREAVDHCDALLRSRLPRPLLSVLYPDPDDPMAAEAMNDMTYGQPAMFVLEYALASLWRSWGIQPAAVAGHSLGEYAAACIAGVFSLEDALMLIAERGRLMQQLPEDGLMVTAFASEDQIAPLLAPYAAEVSMAAINSPETIVLSGRRAAVEQVVVALTAQAVRTRVLNISRAAHSPMVEPMIPAMGETCSRVQFAEPEIEFFSTVTGQVAGQELTRPQYWQRHLRQTVRFADAVQSLYDAGYRVFLEIGPHPTLINLTQRTLPDGADAVLLASLKEGQPAREQMLESAARLYTSGAALEWEALNGPAAGPHLNLPAYPWDHRPYWWQVETAKPAPAAPAWETALRAGQRQAYQAPLDLQIERFPARWDALNNLAIAYMGAALRQLGAFQQPGERLTVDALLERYRVLPTYHALMERWLAALSGCGWLARESDGAYRQAAGLPETASPALQAEVQTLFRDAPYVAEYLNTCGQHLAAVITGEESPLEMMFPDGSMHRAENLYQNWAHARYFNQIVGALAEAIAHADPGRPLRLLEIGAGTGATTASVLPVLPQNASYHFTDVSDLFLDRARQKFSAYPFVQYGLLDIEQDGLSQGYGRGQFDVIIAANVLHATRSLSDTLAHTRDLLAPGGLLIQFEATTHLTWYDITTGLIEGWQSFRDDLRANSPLLPSATWETLLHAAGFEDVAVFPPPGSPAEILGESVILARTSAPVEAVATLLDNAAQPAATTAATAAQPADDLLQQLANSLPDERRERLLDFVRQNVMAILRLDASSAPDRKARLMDLGVDSLMAVELRGRLGLGLKLDRKLPATLIFDYPTIEAITDYLLRDVLRFTTPAANATAATATPIDDLSDEQVEAMLLAKLKGLQE